MAEAGRLLARVFTHLDSLTLAGMSTLEINDLVERMIVDDLHARPASKGQYGFPYVLNASIDNVSSALARIGTKSKALETHRTFVGKLTDALEAGVENIE